MVSGQEFDRMERAVKLLRKQGRHELAERKTDEHLLRLESEDAEITIAVRDRYFSCSCCGRSTTTTPQASNSSACSASKSSLIFGWGGGWSGWCCRWYQCIGGAFTPARTTCQLWNSGRKDGRFHSTFPNPPVSTALLFNSTWRTKGILFHREGYSLNGLS